MNRKIIILFLGLIMISSVYALGVTPARTTLDFKEGIARTVDFDVLNSAGKDMKVVLTAQGELGQYIRLSDSEAVFSASESSKAFSYSFDLPDDLSPGLHTGEVFILEVPTDGDLSGASVLATLAVVTQLYVYAPYPGKYALSEAIIYNANKGDDVTFVFPVASVGEFDLTSVRANVDIYNSLGMKIDSFNTDSISVPSGTKKELVYNWKADVEVGDYRAVATLIYDEGTINLNGTFTVGSRDLELQEIAVNGFSLGDIAKLEMLVENKWSEPISGAHIETKIRNERGDLVSSFESASYDVEPLAKQTFVSYWDTAGVREGTYETEVSINYADKTSKKNLKFEVTENDLTVVGLGYVISSGGEDGGMNTLIVVLIIVIVFLVLINLLWFFLLRKRLKK